MPKLCVNVDHIATLRQARLTHEPDPVHASFLAELGGASGIIVHLREDRRHITDRDVELLRKTLSTGLHLEMAATLEMRDIALQQRPDMVCLVPEKRQELTTEGGLDLLDRERELQDYLADFSQAGISTSLFIDPDPDQIRAAQDIGTEYVELHTGAYADAEDPDTRERELDRLRTGIQMVQEAGLAINLGHGLDYTNVSAFAATPGIKEYSIGHSIVARAALVGMEKAVRQMQEIISRFPD